MRSPGYPDVTSRGPYQPYPLHSKIDHKICIKVVNFPSWTLGLSGSFQLEFARYIYNIITIARFTSRILQLRGLGIAHQKLRQALEGFHRAIAVQKLVCASGCTSCRCPGHQQLINITLRCPEKVMMSWKSSCSCRFVF